MKKKTIKKAEYFGEGDSSAFIVSFQIQILRSLKKRGLLSENQCDKGISFLKERKC